MSRVSADVQKWFWIVSRENCDGEAGIAVTNVG